MKKDLGAPLTRGAQRTLGAFHKAMLTLLTEQPLGSVSINALCERAGYPRATFYNYFDDRDDLLDYCWLTLTKQANLDDLAATPSERRVDVALDAMADMLERNAATLQAIMRHNPPEGPLFGSLHRYVESQAHQIMRSCIDRDRFGLPADLVADHYANTMLLVLDWSYVRGHALTRGRLHEIVHALLGGVE
ncbi:TetR/AcrR family transcriptional regulator [Bifidobacterium leontopitheci]|uniref:Transcriptional regulator n=1 Tax=Bifidobacterium leontopitheci TaxID=2650774 RepID=A0A6I1GGA4_9BIFI|nr:TetR/AcrR family transcriptional regulator [Bifidobacterium leontopitheci]KAB7790683.1 transcriptional regulator [Bifidobacterium leontopitheci]